MKRVRLTSESEFVGLTTPMDDWNFQISSIWPRVRSASRPFRMETQCFFLMFSHVPLFTFLNDFFIVQFYAHCSQRASQRAAMEFACRNEVPMMQPPTAAAAASVPPAFVRSEVSLRANFADPNPREVPPAQPKPATAAPQAPAQPVQAVAFFFPSPLSRGGSCYGHQNLSAS